MYVCLHMCGLMCVELCVHMYAFVFTGPRLIILNYFHLIHWGSVSQSDPELTDRTSLASQLALGDSLTLPSNAGVIGGSLTHLAFMWLLGIKILVLILVPYHRSLNHGAI